MIGIVIGKISGSSNGSGSLILTGSGSPSVLLGKDGDFYIDKANPGLYGPKINGMWPSPIPFGGTSLVSTMDSTDPYTVIQTGDQNITLPVTNPRYIELYVNGLLQKESFFTVNGAIATVLSSLNVQPGDVIEFTFETVSGDAASNVGIPVEEYPSGTINSINKNFALSFIPIINTLNLYVNGLRINKTEYILDGLNIILNNAPDKQVVATYNR